MLKWIAGTAAGLLAFGYMLKLNRASQNIQTSVAAKVHKVGLSGITLKILATIKNPNKLTLTLQKPLVTVAYEGKTLGTSKLEDDKITVPQYGEKTFDMDMHFGWLSLTQSLGLSVVEKIRGKGKAAIDIDTVITTSINGIPYAQSETVTLTF